MPTHLKESFEQAHFAKAVCEWIVVHFERELKLTCSEAVDEVLENTLNQLANKFIAERPKPLCHNCE